MTAKKARVFLFTVLAALSLFFLLEKGFLPGLSSKLPSYKSFELLGKVILLIKNDYVEETNPARAMNGAYRGLVNSLDKLSSYLDKKSVIKYNQRKDANIKDIGVILYKIYGTFPRIIGVVKNSPSEKKGIQTNDIISAIDGRSTLMMSLAEINLYFKDRETKPIQLRILRGNETLEINLERSLLFEEPFTYTLTKGTSGILTIHHLYHPCTNIIKDTILPKLKSQKMTLILDLRNCYEGDIEEAQKLINLFLKSQKIGYFERKNGAKKILTCPNDAELEKLPLVVWINQATLGPAEAVAGVLQELKKARIIGLPTPGLVAEQDFFPLEDGSGLLLTSGIFHLRSGKTLWEKGVKPDVKIKRENQNLDTYLKKSLSPLP